MRAPRAVCSTMHRLGGRRFVVTNPLVWRFHGERIAEALPGAESILVPDGERHKHLATVARIYEALVRGRADRGSASSPSAAASSATWPASPPRPSFAASRSCRCRRRCSRRWTARSAGKVGVNLAPGKNLIGAFYQPRAVVIDPLVLATLPRREFRAGLYEVVKYGDDLQRRAVRPGCSADAPESSPIPARKRWRRSSRNAAASRRASSRPTSASRGPRRVLNFGHTAGHALEASPTYRRFRHGEAVAYGMLVAGELAVERGVLRRDAARGAESLVIARSGPLPPIADLPAGAAARRDAARQEGGRRHAALRAADRDRTSVDRRRRDGEGMSAMRCGGWGSRVSQAGHAVLA